MQLEGGYNAAPSPNKKLYNAGSEWQDDIEGLADYYSTFFREYDAMIGRFNGVDPMSESFESWTTYHYSYNNPVNFNDPMGNLVKKAETDRGRFFEYILNNLETERQPAGLGNYTIMYSGDDEYGNGGGGSAESLNLDNPVSLAVFDLQQQWSVNMASLGKNGFNNVAYNVISGGGATMTFGGDKFKNLTAGETVRQQVKNDNFDDAFNTILAAYKDVLNFAGGQLQGYTFSRRWTDKAGGHFTYELSGKMILQTFDKDVFRAFANNNTAVLGRSFGFLVRSIYHEYIHAWDIAGINSAYPQQIKSTDHLQLEFRAYYLMGSKNVRLPNMTDKEKYIYMTEVLHHSNNGVFYGDLYNNYLIKDPAINIATKSMYGQWYRYIKSLK